MHAALPLIRSIYPGLLPDNGPPPALQAAVKEFTEATGIQDTPPTSFASSQRAWDNLSATVYRDRMIDSANQLHRARLVAASQPYTAAWLQAVPVPSLGLHLDEETVRVAVALRLGASICERHRCHLCGRQVDELGHHGLSCAKSAGRLLRHAHLNDVVKRGLASAGIPAILEPVGLDREDGKRPDGLTLFPYSGGKCLTWDATCTDTFAETALAQTALEPGAAARAAETRKNRHYTKLSERYIFVPVAVETSGVFGPVTAKFIRELGLLITARTGERREGEWLRQRLSIALMRGNAAAVLATVATDRTKRDFQIAALKSSAAQTTVRSRPKQHASAQLTPASLTPEAANSTGKPAQHRDLVSPPKVKGLVNLGNTCYLNSTLQCLSQCHYLSHYLDINSRSGRKLTIGDQRRPIQLLLPEAGSITTSLCDFLKQMHTSGTTENVSPSHLLRKLAMEVPHFIGYDQQDAHELLRSLLQQVRLENLRRHERQIMLSLGLPTRTDPKQVPDRQAEDARQAPLSPGISHHHRQHLQRSADQRGGMSVLQDSHSPDGTVHGPLTTRYREQTKGDFERLDGAGQSFRGSEEGAELHAHEDLLKRRRSESGNAHERLRQSERRLQRPIRGDGEGWRVTGSLSEVGWQWKNCISSERTGPYSSSDSNRIRAGAERQDRGRSDRGAGLRSRSERRPCY